MIIGIDEAGRGAVVGPMVITAFICQSGQQESLGEFEKLTDSKLLSSSERTNIRKELDEYDFENFVIGHNKIDQESLGKLFREVIFETIKEYKPDKLIIDSPVPPNNLADYRDEILARTALDMEVVCENEADLNYPIVSAASIVAKTKRDQRIEKISKKYRTEISGYPSDKKTKKFLKNFYKKHKIFPPETRMKWKTVKKIREEVDQRKIF